MAQNTVHVFLPAWSAQSLCDNWRLLHCICSRDTCHGSFRGMAAPTISAFWRRLRLNHPLLEAEFHPTKSMEICLRFLRRIVRAAGCKSSFEPKLAQE